MESCEFRGAGFRVQGLGCLGFGVGGLGFKAYCSGPIYQILPELTLSWCPSNLDPRTKGTHYPFLGLKELTSEPKPEKLGVRADSASFEVCAHGLGFRV